MKGKKKKITQGVVLIVIGLPVAFVAALFVWAATSDRTNGALISSGVTRRYLLYVPQTYDRSKATPLVISLHAAALWPAAQMAISRWNQLADVHGFIVVYPAGTGAFFGGSGPGPHVWPMGPRGLFPETVNPLTQKREGVKQEM